MKESTDGRFEVQDRMMGKTFGKYLAISKQMLVV